MLTPPRKPPAFDEPEEPEEPDEPDAFVVGVAFGVVVVFAAGATYDLTGVDEVAGVLVASGVNALEETAVQPRRARL